MRTVLNAWRQAGAAALLLATVTGPARAQSTLPAAVNPVSSKAGMSVADPEQLSERTPGHLVQDLHAAFGAHAARAVHAKGTILLGSFEPTAEARALSRASLFRGPVPVIVRFSDFTGLPAIPDNAGEASPRGFAVKFLLPDGSSYDVVNHSFNGFPVATASEFGELLEAIGASGKDAANPTALDAFLGSHPLAKRFLTSQDPPPVSWATTSYFGVNAFAFIDAAQRSRFVRFRFLPEAGGQYLKAADAVKRRPDYLATEIAERVAHGPIRFAWFAQLSAAGDAIEDPSAPWPESRELVKLGVVTIDRMGPQTPLADKSLSFLPGTTPPGIAIADPMLAIRNAAYPLSFHERQ